MLIIATLFLKGYDNNKSMIRKQKMDCHYKQVLDDVTAENILLFY